MPFYIIDSKVVFPRCLFLRRGEADFIGTVAEKSRWSDRIRLPRREYDLMLVFLVFIAQLLR